MSRRVLVTGAASGLGLALVRRFASGGDRVLATDRAESVDVLPDSVEYLPMDVRSDDDWARVHEWVASEWNGLDVLVNNAGVAAAGRIDRVTMDEWQWITDINLLGVARGCHTFAGMFKQQRSGHIVNVASIAGLVHPPGMSSYNAVKAAVVALSETLGHELAPYDVSCSVACPSFFRTNLAASLRGSDTDVEKKAAQLINTSNLSADDVAAVVLEGIAKRNPLILTDRVGRMSYWTKRLCRPLYDRQMATTARRTFEREQAAAASPAPPRAEGAGPVETTEDRA